VSELTPREVAGEALLLGDRPLSEGSSGQLWRCAIAGPGGPRLAVCHVAAPWLVADPWSRAVLLRRVMARSALVAEGAPRHFGAWELEGNPALPGRVPSIAVADAYAGDLRVTEIASMLSEAAEANAPLPARIALALALPVARVHWGAVDLGRVLGEDLRLAFDPKGILLDWDGRVRVVIDPTPTPESRSHPTEGAGAVTGDARNYLAPERVSGEPCDGIESVWSLGVFLFELLAGANPFRRENPLDTLQAIRQATPPPLAPLRPDLPASLCHLVAGCLGREPHTRLDVVSFVGALEDEAHRYGPVPPEELAALLARALPRRRRDAIALREQFARLDVERLRASVPKRRARPLDLSGRLVMSPDGRELPVGDAPGDASFGDHEQTPLFTAMPATVAPPGVDGRPMLLVRPGLFVDVQPVSYAAFMAFLVATARLPPAAWRGHLPPPALVDEPVTLVAHDDAIAYAEWAGRRLPTDDEWQLAVDVLGGQLAGLGVVWEWTCSGAPGVGYIARGGRYRDVPDEAPRPSNRTFALRPSADLGFRCATDASVDYRRR
jgi:hypothetical protein